MLHCSNFCLGFAAQLGLSMDCSLPSVQLGQILHCVLSVQLGLVVQLGPSQYCVPPSGQAVCRFVRTMSLVLTAFASLLLSSSHGVTSSQLVSSCWMVSCSSDATS